MTDKDQEKKLKEAYMEYQVMQQTVQQLQKQIETVQEQLQEVSQISENIQNMKEIKKDTELLVPVANGIFLKTKLADNNDLVVNVGSNTVVKKSFPQVYEMLGKQQKDMEDMYTQLLVQFQGLHTKSQELEQHIQKLAQ